MADPLDVLSLSEAHAAINLSNSVTNQDTAIAMFVTAISRNLDDLFGPIVSRAVTSETYDGTDSEDYDRNNWNVSQDAFTHNGSPVGPLSPLLGRTVIALKSWPVLSVTSVVEYTGTTSTTLTQETNGTSPTSGFRVNLAKGLLYRRSGGRDWYFPTGRDNVVVTYQAGRYASTATVDARFKLAATIVMSAVWPQQAGAWAQSADPYGQQIIHNAATVSWGMFPAQVQQMLWKERQDGTPLGVR